MLSKKETVKPGDSVRIVNLLLFRSFDSKNGALYNLCKEETHTQYCICLDIVNTNNMSIIQVLTEYGIRYSLLRIFQNSATVDNLARGG